MNSNLNFKKKSETNCNSGDQKNDVKATESLQTSSKSILNIPGLRGNSISDQNLKNSTNRRFTFNSQMLSDGRFESQQQLIDFGVGVDQKVLPFRDEETTKEAPNSHSSQNPNIFFNQAEYEQNLYDSKPLFFYSKHQQWRPLKSDNHLTQVEKTFLEAAERGDKFTVLRCLSLKPTINVNCMNMIGTTALQMAVDNENVEIVELLLRQPSIVIGDALLYAIQEGVYRIVEMLIDHPSITKGMLGMAWSSPDKKESHDFSSDISPVILAAICNQFEILQLLLTRGAQIERPHRLSCTCKKCFRLQESDSFKHSLWRINSYKALASPAWISLTSSDPVLAAFKLSWELTNLAKIENEFKDTYNSLSLQCRKYACDLLDQCRSTEEVMAILNRKDNGSSSEEESDDDEDDESYENSSKLGFPIAAFENNSKEEKNNQNDETKEEQVPEIDDDGFVTSGAAYVDEDSYLFEQPSSCSFIMEFIQAMKAFFSPNSEHKLARLNLAIKYEQKRFVSHPHCQHILTALWYDRLPGWRRHNILFKLIIVIAYLIILPFCITIYLIYPYGRVGFLLKSPMIKFLNHSSSFAVFLILLLTASATKGRSDEKERSMIRGPEPNTIELLILWWVLGFIWAEMKQIWDEGHKAYVRQWWNWLDFIMLSLYLMTICLRGSALLMRRFNLYGFTDEERIFWPDDDPTLISEALFSIAHVFSFARIIFLFQVNEHLGPLQISLGNMLIDITKFIFIFVLIITSFACGIHQLFFYYNAENQDYRPRTFRTLIQSYKTLFWCLFGVNTPDLHRVRNNSEEVPSARITNIVSEVLLLVYHLMAIIVLVNMLIAMMSNSFQTIQNQADIEWKFARSKLWVGYFDEGSTLPPPFNTIVSPKSIQKIITKFLKWLWHELFQRFFCYERISDKQTKQCDHIHIDVLDFEIQRNHEYNRMNSQRIKRERRQMKRQREDERYQTIMRRLVRRYIHLAKKHMRQDGVNEDDLLEIKQDISSLRYELREDRKREIARSIGHLESIRADIMNSLTSEKNGPKKRQDLTNSKRNSAIYRSNSNHGNLSTGPHKDSNESLEGRAPIPKERVTTKESVDPFGGKMQSLYDEIKRLALTSSLYEADTNSEVSILPTHEKLQDIILHDFRKDISSILKKELSIFQSQFKAVTNGTREKEESNFVIIPPLANRQTAHAETNPESAELSKRSDS